MVKSDLGDSRGALQDLDRAVEVGQGKTVLPLVNRSTLKNRVGDHRGAAADASRAIELQPGHVVARLNRAMALERLGDKEGAAEDFRAALRIDPENDEAKAGLERVAPREAPRPPPLPWQQGP